MILEGKSAIVTGGAQGVGLGIASVLGREGAAVVIADLNLEEAEKASRALQDEGVRATAVHADVRDTSSVRDMVTRTLKEFGRLDTLVNNAGVALFKSFLDHTVDETSWLIETNLTGTINCTQAAVPAISESGGGSIVNIASIAALRYTTQHTVYAATKAAISALSRDVAYELGPAGVRVNCIAPGPVRSPFTEAHMAPSAKAAYDRALRVGRWGVPEDIGELTAFLSSDRAEFITGQTIAAAGGSELRVLAGADLD